MKKINTELFKSIIKSDFFLFEKKVKLLKKFVTVFNITEIQLSLKQFIRLIQFLQKKNSLIYLLSDLKKFANFFDFCLKKKKISSLFFLLKQKSNLYINTNLLISLNSNFVNKPLNLKNIFQKNIFLVSEIIFSFNTYSNNSTYKIFNDINNFKKITFLIIIIQLIFLT